MKAFLIEQAGQCVVTEIPKPEPAADEILLEVRAAGVCGTDIHIYKGEYMGTYPRVAGHEFSGVVAAVGKNVTKFRVGQRVSADPNIFCEGCPACQRNNQNFCEHFGAVGVTRHGGFAQFLTVPERCVFDIGDIEFADASMIEPLACVVYGQMNARPPIGGRVLIIGAGPIGLLHVQMAAINGAAEITVVDLFEEKLKLARELGADKAYTSQAFEELGDTNAYELVIDCTGVPKVIEGAVKYVKDAGTMLFFGVCPDDSRISVNPYEIFSRELKLVGSFALKKSFGQAVDLVRGGRIKLAPLVSDRLKLEEAPAYFAKVAQGGNSGMKAVILPNG